MPLKSGQKEKDISEELWKDAAFKGLNDQMELDYKYIYNYKFKMPKKEGDWKEISDNAPRILAGKVSMLLASSRMNLYAYTTDEKMQEREEIANTERVANGAIFAADRNKQLEVMGKTTQEELSWSATHRGGTITRVWLYESGNKCYPDIRVYDPLYSRWTDDRFEFASMKKKDSLERKYSEMYKKNPKRLAEIKKAIEGMAQQNGDVPCKEIWYFDEWGILIDDVIIEEHEVPYKRMPIKISNTGIMPYIRSKNYKDNIKNAWMSVLFNNRELYDEKSFMLSVLKSRAYESALIRIVGEYDSRLGSGDQPTELENLGYHEGDMDSGTNPGRNLMTLLDKAKGEEFKGLVHIPNVTQLFEFFTILNGMDMLGSMDPVAWGQAHQSGMSGTLANELRNAALEFMIPFRKRVEEDFSWIGEEICRQFKGGDFEKTRFRGEDKYKRVFDVDYDPNEISDEEYFKCDLVVDRLRDEAQEVEIAGRKVGFGFSSRKSAMLDHNLQADPDHEIQLIKGEQAENDPVMWYDNMAKYFADLGTDEGDRRALYFARMAEVTMDRVISGELAPPPIQMMGTQETTSQLEPNRIGSETEQFV